MFASIRSALGNPDLGILVGLSLLIASYLAWDGIKHFREDRRQKRDRARRRKQFLSQAAPLK